MKKRIRMPEGFWFKFVTHKNATREDKWDMSEDTAVLIKLYDKKNRFDDPYWTANEPIGTIELVKCDKGKRVCTHSDLNDEYHGKKLGALMYAYAIKWGIEHGYKVKSSGSSSTMARRVWAGKTIRSHFKIRSRKHPRLDPKNPEWYSPTWYAYKKVKKA
jgi:GNAT superfamily N-acetyltransferase